MPQLWGLVDELKGACSEYGFYTMGYTDDIAFLMSDKFPNTISELLQLALNMVQQSSDGTQLSINPQKKAKGSFNRKENLKGLRKPTVSRQTLQLTTPVRHLGLILDNGLALKEQMKNVAIKPRGLTGPLRTYLVKLGA